MADFGDSGRESRKALADVSKFKIWSGARDLNPGPHGPEPSVARDKVPKDQRQDAAVVQISDLRLVVHAPERREPPLAAVVAGSVLPSDRVKPRPEPLRTSGSFPREILRPR